MPELLLELGMEELPASFIERAFIQLREEICRRLTEESLSHGASESLGTPRRLIVRVSDLAPMQPDRVSENRGPALKAAYDESGAPTKALEGFCRGQGVSVADLTKDDTYVWAKKTVPGKPTLEVLPGILEAAIRALTFDKSMRWGANRMRFARPIRWILAAYDGALVPFSVETVSSGLTSRGHRFNFPDEFPASSWDGLIAELRSREVEPDPNVRRQRIVDGATKVASGTPEMSDVLIDENVFLTEWPQALEGEFKPDFMGLPEPVLITAMAKHERFFPVRDASKKITNKFISIRNGGDETTVRNGNAWVLNARFNDAKFFFDEDQNFSLDDFLAKTDRMLFQEKLGTVRQRSERLAALAAALADGPDQELAKKAGLYMKADLSTGLVSELSSLQGVIGGEYARMAGWPEPICHALSVQYGPEKVAAADTQEGRVARCVIAADQLDKLAGYLGLGLAPTGSSDPFGLRRAVTVLIDLALAWPGHQGWRSGFQQALDLYAAAGHALDGASAEKSLGEIFAGRYKALMPEARYDLLEAALLDENTSALLNPRSVRFRLNALELCADHSNFIQTATRPLNIVAAAKKKGLTIPALDAEHLDSESGAALASHLAKTRAVAEAAVSQESPAALVECLRELAGPINAFFDTTMVMVEDTKVRDARLALLELAGAQLMLAGDWTKVVVE